MGRLGIEVKIDRWTLQAGRRLWDQIDSFIRNPDRTDAWAIYATQNSLTSEACREEYAYALSRALDTRGADFPLIGIFPGPVADDLIPGGLKARLYVRTTDPNWKERVAAAVERRPTTLTRTPVDPVSVQLRTVDGKHVIELRPRAGVWNTFFGAVPLAEKHSLNPNITYGAPGSSSWASALMNVEEGTYTNDSGQWWFRQFAQQISPTLSAYIICDDVPSAILFGDFHKGPEHRVEFRSAGARSE